MDNRGLPAGRLGLALSGGGFRASFFHIGTLARMAEMGMLRHVEIISTVSGGSIVGAAYYILLKQLLENKADSDITDQDYVELVQRLETHFLTSVQKNLRLRTFANLWKNIRMFSSRYSRSDAIGELYDFYIYRELLGADGPIMMTDLLIHPDGDADFHPLDKERGNCVRRCKVPILVLNATSLNAGHNWVFTATSMGEVPPRNLNFRDLDKKDRYRRVRYDQITTRLPNFPLGKAVAASAGVPGLFPPMAVSDLYSDRTVQLVDGGVYDNQGISGLLDPDHVCTDLVISDASGQSDAIDQPRTDTLGVLSQASAIMMGRVREEEVNCIEQSMQGHVAYFHLKRGLFAHDIEYNKQGVSKEPGRYMRDGIVSCSQAYGVDPEIQNAISEIRTDLDSFSRLEAGTLAADAWLMSAAELEKLPQAYRAQARVETDWAFRRWIPAMQQGDSTVLTHLKVGKNRFLKPYRLMKTAGLAVSAGLLLRSLPVLLILILYVAGLIAGGVWLWHNEAFMSLRLSDFAPQLASALAWLAAYGLLEQFSRGTARWVRMIRQLFRLPVWLLGFALRNIILPFLLFLPIYTYVHTVDPYFVRRVGEIQD